MICPYCAYVEGDENEMRQHIRTEHQCLERDDDKKEEEESVEEKEDER